MVMVKFRSALAKLSSYSRSTTQVLYYLGIFSLPFSNKGFDTYLAKEMIQEYTRQHKKRTLNDCISSKPRTHRHTRTTWLSPNSQSYAKSTRFLRASTSTQLRAVTNFEDLCQVLFVSTLDPTEKTFRNLKIDKSTVHKIVLVYNYTRIPRIMNLVSHVLNGKEFNSRTASLSNNTTIQDSPLLDIAPP
ncbi:heat shock protein 70 [Flagelloscypha sp. PMI_526]|nr:heat shock protein 70 [Flagelloscypha sp. PMI_526]